MAIDTIGVNALATGSITSAKIADGTIIAADVADGSVTTVKLADDAVTSAKLGASAVDATALANNAVTTAKVLDGAVTQAKTTSVGGLIKLSTVEVAAGSATDYAFNFTNIFSSTYHNYFFTFTVATNETSSSAHHMYCQFGNGGTYVTASNACRGGSSNFQLGSNAHVAYGEQNYHSTQGIHQLNGTLVSTENGMFTGTGIITNPFDSNYPVQVQTKCIMQYLSTEVNSWGEEGYSREDNGDKASYTDVRFGVIVGNSQYTAVASNAARRDTYGHMTFYGMLK